MRYTLILNECQSKTIKWVYFLCSPHVGCPKGMYSLYICLVCKPFILRKTPRHLDLNKEGERVHPLSREGEVVCVMNSKNLLSAGCTCPEDKNGHVA